MVVGFIGGMVLPPAIYADSERKSYAIRGVAAIFVVLTIFCGAIAIWQSFRWPDDQRRMMNTAFPALPSSADLPEYIERAEKALSKRDYSREAYALDFARMSRNLGR